MLVQFRSQFPEDLRDHTEIYGLGMLGFNAHDYYRLAGLFINEGIDIIVMPVNLRSFESVWMEFKTVSYPQLMPFVRLEEIPRAAYRLTDGNHNYRWDLVSLRKLDYIYFGGDVGRYFQGLKKVFEDQFERWDAGLMRRFPGLNTPLPESWLSSEDLAKLPPAEQAKLNPAIQYPETIARDHPTMKAFLEFNRLARKHDFQIVYYTVQPNPLQGAAVRHFPFVRNVLSDSPNVHFLDVLGTLQTGHFSLGEHLNPNGIQVLSAQLGDEVGELVRDSIDE